MPKSSLKEQSISEKSSRNGKDDSLKQPPTNFHWTRGVYICKIYCTQPGVSCLKIEGGSDRGEYHYVGEILYEKIHCFTKHNLEVGDIILQVEEHKVAGYTQLDVQTLLDNYLKEAKAITVKAVKKGALTKNLRKFLNTRFPKGSVDHEFQNTVRDNLYLCTVPCTTRPPREGEVNGVNYSFLTVDDFMKLEKSGQLLESGIYEGNYYGTPRPLPDQLNLKPDSKQDILLPGLHPSSEGKRKRNRSNVEAMSATSTQQILDASQLMNSSSLNNMSWNNQNGPPPSGEPERTCKDLPYGWERIDDPHYGTYYIDHVNRRTQYENPAVPSTESDIRIFTRNPEELHGDIIESALVKSPAGFGFTIVGGDAIESEEFLQIKSIVPNGPAWADGKLKTGDVLVFVNSTCVLGYTHQDVVSLFQSISPGEMVNLQVCRGYPLPFDPNDPYTEIVTTLAVSANSNTLNTSVDQSVYTTASWNSGDHKMQQESGDGVARPAKSLPDLRSQNGEGFAQKSNSSDLLSSSALDPPDILDFNSQSATKPEFITVEIVKGTNGFGFTIADSVFGQKVKKILDQPRCQFLQEGDILIEINNKDVRRLPHSDIVKELKECPCGEPASITVQRGGMVQTLRGKKLLKTRSEDTGSLHKENTFSHYTSGSLDLSSIKQGIYRSKTPTADIYSSKDKDQITINRPKTPIVDSRNWTRAAGPPLEQQPGFPRNNSSSDNFLMHTPMKNAEFQQNSGGVKQPPTSLCQDPLCTNEKPNGHPNANAKTCYETCSNCYMPDYHLKPEEGGELCWSCYAQESSQQNSYPPWKYRDGRNPETGSLSSYSTRGPDYRNPYPAYRGMPDTIGGPPMMYQKFNGKLLCNAGDGDSGYNSNLPQQKLPLAYSMPYGSPSNSHLSLSQDSSLISSPVHLDPTQQDCYHRYYNSGYMPTSHVPQYNENMPYSKQSTSFEHEQPMHAPHLLREPRSLSQSGVPHIYRKMSPVPEATEMNVTLLRKENGFGFRIVGGTEEGSQVSIGHIVPGGAADLDTRIQTGDEIVSVDGQSVLNTSHHHVVQLMGSAAHTGRVNLGIRRPRAASEVAYPKEPAYPYDVTVTRKESEGFGFVIISSVNRAGSTIGRIIESSPAQQCNQLNVGDRIVAVNGQSILNMHHGEIVNLIKDSGYSVTLTIGQPLDDTSSTASTPQKGEEYSCDAEDQYYAVELHRSARGFGFSIRGGKEFQSMPLFVLRIAEGGPAHQDGRLQVGDEIIEINGINTKNMTHAEAIEIIRQGGMVVRLLIKRSNILSAIPSMCHFGPPDSICLASPVSSPVENGPISQSSPRVLSYTDVYGREPY